MRLHFFPDIFGNCHCKRKLVFTSPCNDNQHKGAKPKLLKTKNSHQHRAAGNKWGNLRCQLWQEAEDQTNQNCFSFMHSLMNLLLSTEFSTTSTYIVVSVQGYLSRMKQREQRVFFLSLISEDLLWFPDCVRNILEVYHRGNTCSDIQEDRHKRAQPSYS